MATIDPEYQKAQQEKERHTEELMSLSNVVGVGIGRKSKEGQKVHGWAILVYVKKKVPISKLDLKDVIPAEINGIPTDVIEIGEPIIYNVNSR